MPKCNTNTNTIQTNHDSNKPPEIDGIPYFGMERTSAMAKSGLLKHITAFLNMISNQIHFNPNINCYFIKFFFSIIAFQVLLLSAICCADKNGKATADAFSFAVPRLKPSSCSQFIYSRLWPLLEVEWKENNNSFFNPNTIFEPFLNPK